MFIDKATERKVRSFVIKCPRGCQWTGELRSKEVGVRAHCNLAFVVIALATPRLHPRSTCMLFSTWYSLPSRTVRPF